MVRTVLSGVAIAVGTACGAISSSAVAIVNPQAVEESPGRAALIARAQLWTATNVRTIDIRTGPREPGAFPFLGTVVCDYFQKDLSGASPKFPCRSGEDELKVKYGGNNAEVFGEVAATRLLWALGFGADRMYQVKVICRGCPPSLGGIAKPNDKEFLFDPATIERKMPAPELEPDSSWAWTELDAIDEEKGGAPVAHRDALKLLAVFIQHTDTKPQQQRIVCLGSRDDSPTADNCRRPFMMVSDVGLTFGRATRLNANEQGMNFVAWAATPIWKEGVPGCVGNLPKSLTGTLNDPVIGEAGRAFLARLLSQLSDAQIRQLFEVARVNIRLRDPLKAKSGYGTIDEWTDVFKRKRAEIVQRRCA